VAGCCECDDEPSGSGTTELVIVFAHRIESLKLITLIISSKVNYKNIHGD
jgi:hypothetical protein